MPRPKKPDNPFRVGSNISGDGGNAATNLAALR